MAAISSAASYSSAAERLEALDDVSLAQQAHDWGYERLGRPLPEGVSLDALAEEVLPDSVYELRPHVALGRALLPAALMVAAYAWLAYMTGVCPLWQRLLCWAAAGTGYFGLFMLASDAARFALVPREPLLQDMLGATLMAPALWSFEAWRLAYFNHLACINMLGEDTDAWQPLTLAELSSCSAGAALRARLLLGTPLKLLGSIGAWWSSWGGADLKPLVPASRKWALLSAAVPLAFAALVFPALLAAGGLAAVATYWLAPWLVFHAWLSALTLVQHTAPHIPFVREGLDYDPARAAVNGTVTLLLPRALELAINDANYHLPAHISASIPSYRLREAHLVLRERLGPYITEARPNMKLLLGLMTAWLVYDERRQRYLDFDDAEAARATRDYGGEEPPQQQHPQPWTHARSSADSSSSSSSSNASLDEVGAGLQADQQERRLWAQP